MATTATELVGGTVPLPTAFTLSVEDVDEQQQQQQRQEQEQEQGKSTATASIAGASREGESSWTSTEHIQRSLLGLTQSLPRGTANASSSNDKRRSNRPPPPTLASVLGYSSSVTLPLSRDETSASSTPEPVYVSSRNKSILVRPSTSTRSSATTSSNPWSTKSLSLGRSLSDRSLGSDSAPSTSSSSRRLSVFSNRTVADVGPKKVREDARQAAPSQSQPQQHHPQSHALSASMNSAYGSGASAHSYPERMGGPGSAGGFSSFSSPPNSGNSMQTRSPNPGGKASAMLGMSSGGAFSGDPYGGPASATQTFQSLHSDYDSGSKGMSAGKLTLKKAKSLFSSSKSTKSAESTAPLPSSPKSGSGLQAPGYPYGNPSLQHSKSYGSLVGNRGTPQANRTAPESDYRFPSSGNRGYPASSSGRGGGGGLGFEQSYAASPVRKASLPNIDPHRRTTPKIEEEEDCPVCLESLSIRLAGEKAHIVPNCGHKLHADCFEAAYGSPEEYGAGRDELDNLMGSARRQKKAPQGICGICRSEMRLGDPAESKQSKFAAISGQPGYSPNSPPLDTHKLNSISKRTIVPEKEGHSSLHDPSEDHEIVNAHQYLPAYMQHAALGAQRAGGTSHIPSHDRVQPKITVRAEHATIVRPSDPEKKVHLTCMVTVEVPSRIPGLDAATRSTKLRALPLSSGHGSSHSQSTILPNSGGAQSSVSQEPQHFQDRRESNATSHTQASDDFPTSPSASAFSSGIQQLPLPPGSQAPGMEKALSNATHLSAASNPSNTYTTPGTIDTSAFPTPHSVSASSFASPNVAGDGFAAINASSTTLTAAAEEEKAREAHGPFGQVFADLQERMADWKGHQPANFGSLRMYDSLNVKKDKNVREFVVYLFEEALLCVVDDKKKRSSTGSDKLRLKGRVFVKHMKQVEETSTLDTGLSLTINMEDDSLESFVILFSARNTLEVWRLQIQALIDHHRPPVPTAIAPSTHSSAAPTEKRDSVFSNNTSRSDVSRGTKATTAPSAAGSSKDARLHAPPEQAIPPLPSATAGNQTAAGRASQIDEIVASWTAPDPNAFVPLDLMLVISVPNTGSGGPSSSSLKLRLIRSTLDFVIHSVGPRARISIVTYTVGDAAHGCLRKTPWLATGRADGMRQLEQAVAEIAGESVDRHVEGLRTVDAKEQKTTVASAVNLALDIILQRQVKSATSGILLLNDGKDGAAKQQIDLTLVRADAAAIPIHSFGWGKGHDPSSLWLLSNHTRGTYTFVRDFYQLKDAIAGCVGGMLCVAVCALRLHLNVQERRWFKIRKVGGVSNAIVSSDGKDVDINIGDLRYGERKEMLVEIEMVSPRATDPRASRVAASSKLSRKASMTATDDFFMKSLGLDPHSLGELQQQDEFYDEIEDGMADDVPIFDCTASYRSPLDLPNAVSRLPYPTLLTTTVTPPTKDENGVEISAPVDTAGAVSDPGIVRRRMELLISDMMTRTLLLMSRRQDEAAQRLLAETVRITGAIIANIVPPNADEAQVSSEASQANYALKACMTDIESILAGCADRAEFDSVTRNFGAQQAVALRDQRAWTARTATEGLFFSREWTAVFGKRLAAAGF